MAVALANGVRDERRLDIIWIGHPPADIAEAFRRRKLSVKSLSLADAVVIPKASIRAAIVPLTSDLREHLASLFLPVLDSGAALFVSLPSQVDERAHLEAANYAIGTLRRGLAIQPIQTVRAW